MMMVMEHCLLGRHLQVDLITLEGEISVVSRYVHTSVHKIVQFHSMKVDVYIEVDE